MWAAKAKEEHDAFAEALRDKGVQVHYYGQLLAETLDLPDGPGLRPRPGLHARDPRPVPGRSGPPPLRGPRRHGAGGVPRRRRPQGRPAPAAGPQPKWDMLRADDFVLTPLPNHLFQRDNSCWIYGGVTINPMAKPARQRESLHTRAIYRFHPMFAGADFVTYYGDEDRNYQPATIEGGDVHVIGHGAVLIGMGERTTPMAVETVAHALFDAGQATRVVAIELPHSHAFMHLDTVMSMVDTGTFVLYPYFDRHLRSWTISPGERARPAVDHPQPQPVGHPGRDPRGRPRSRCSPPTRTSGPPSASSGTTAPTTSPSPPGSCSGYDRNVATNTMLRKHGIEVVDDRRQRARPGPGWPALHDLPDRARPGMSRHGSRRLSVDLQRPEPPQGGRLHQGGVPLPGRPGRRAPPGEARRDRAPADGRAATSPSSSRRPPPGPGRPSRSAPTTRGRTSPTSGPRSPTSATRRRSRTPPGCWAGCSTGSSTGASPRRPSRPWPASPACRCGTG